MSEPISVPTTKPPSEPQQPSNEPREKSQAIPRSNRGAHRSPELAMMLNDAIPGDLVNRTLRSSL